MTNLLKPARTPARRFGMTAPRCTFHHRGEPACGLIEADPIHPLGDERMPLGGHVFRVEHPEPRVRNPRASEYERGYQAGYHAGQRSRA